MDYASVTKQGEKGYNSDYLTIFKDESSYCFALADGRETPIAAEIAVQSVVGDFKSSGMITKTSVPDFFNNASQKIDDYELPIRACMSFLLTDGSVAVWGNIGDCRIYLLRDKLLYEITPDHSSAYALYEAGDIRYPKIRRQNTRYNLTRILGKGCDSTPHFSQPEVLRPGDSFLVCSDGFWENIHERQVEKTLKRSDSAQDWLNKMVTIVEKNITHKKYTRFRDSYSAITINV